MTASLLKQARPKQWVKNLLVFAAPGAAGVLNHGASLWRAVVAFVAFCLASSGTYFWNDLLDVENDRNHPVKQHRPIASGAISVPMGRTVGTLLLVCGIGLAATTRWQAAIVVAGYVALTTLYSTVLKHIAVVDLVAVAAGFVLRAIAGAAATDVQMSKWFSLTTSFASLFIVAGKRYAELRDLGDASQTRRTLDDYSLGFLRIVLSVSCGAALVTYCIWAFETPEADWHDPAVLRALDHSDGHRVAEVHADSRAGARCRARGDLRPRSCAADPRADLARHLCDCGLLRVTRRSLEDVSALIADVDGWLSPDQVARLYDSAAATRPGQQIVEIGSFRGRSTIVLAAAAPDGVAVVAIDPHAGTDRGPRELRGYQTEAAGDHEVFNANLAAADVADRVRHVREFSDHAHDAVTGPISVLFIDGAHRYSPARADIHTWGARVEDGGTMLLHDSFSSIGVTLAICRELMFGARFRYVGRSRSLAEFRADLGSDLRTRGTNALRQVGQLPWFAKNIALKVLLTLHLGDVISWVTGRQPEWPY